MDISSEIIIDLCFITKIIIARILDLLFPSLSIY